MKSISASLLASACLVLGACSSTPITTDGSARRAATRDPDARCRARAARSAIAVRAGLAALTAISAVATFTSDGDGGVCNKATINFAGP